MLFKFRNLSIVKKLLIVFAVDFSIFLVYVLMGYFFTTDNVKKLDAITNTMLPVSYIYSDNMNMLEDIATAFSDVVLTHEIELLESIEREKEIIVENFSKLQKDYAENVSKDKDDFLHYYDLAYKFTLATINDKQTFDIVQMTNLKDATQKNLASFQNNKENSFKKLKTTLNEITKNTQSFLYEMFAVALLGITFLLSNAFFLYYMLSNSFKNIIASIKSLATNEADFSNRLVVSSNDEIGEIIKWFNELQSKLELDYLKMAELKNELEIALDESKKAAQSKDDFLSSMSHEIRTPLNAIIGFVDIMLKKDSTEEKRRKYLEIIQQSGKNLLRIINDILDFTKMQGGKLSINYNKVNLQKILYSSCKLYNEQAKTKGVIYSFVFSENFPNELVVDEIRITQILNNFISNALKFTPASCTIDISVTYKESDSLLEVKVKDTGIGIEKEKHQSIFDPFEQEDSSTTREYGGTGLGLAICLNLIEMMDGELIFESIKGVGSTFGFVLKAQLPEKS